MKNYEPDKYQGFLYSAYKDVLAVETLGEFSNIHYEAIAFHAQQAAEKMIKNALTEAGIAPPKTHNIDDLLTLAIDHQVLSPEKEDIVSAVRLSQYAVNVRYTQMPDIQAGEVISAIYDCNQISKMLEKAGFETIKIKMPKSLIKPRSLTEREISSRQISKELENKKIHNHDRQDNER